MQPPLAQAVAAQVVHRLMFLIASAMARIARLAPLERVRANQRGVIDRAPVDGHAMTING